MRSINVVCVASAAITLAITTMSAGQAVIADPFSDGQFLGGADLLGADIVSANQIDGDAIKAIATDALLDPAPGGKVLQYSITNGGDRTLVAYSRNGSTPGFNAMFDGSRVRLSMKVRIANSLNGSALTPAAPTNLNFRVGMYNNNGTRQPGDTTGTALGNGSATALIGDDSGYFTVVGANGRDSAGAEVLATNQSYIVREAGTADPIWFGGDRIFTGGNNGTTGNLLGSGSFTYDAGSGTFGRLSVDGTVYTMSLDFIRNAGGTATLRSEIRDAANTLIAGTSSTDTNPLNVATGFNEVTFLMANNTSVMAIDDVRLEYIVPEPTSLATLALGGLLSRRRQ